MAAIETRFARDVQELVGWIKGSPIEPKTISDSNFAASRLLTLRTRNSAAYKGLHALLMNDGCLDFLEGKTIDIQTFTDGAIDIHHIFPQKWCDEASDTKVAVRLDHQPKHLSLHRRTGSSVVAHPAPTWAALNAVPQSTSHGWMSWSAPMPSTHYCSEQTILTPSSQGVRPNSWTGSRSQRAGPGGP